jgi:hypothetical protein
VNIANATGDPAVGTTLATHLVDVGLVVGTVTAGAASATASAIEYPDSQKSEARRLAGVLVQAPLLTPAVVPHITLVLGDADPSGLLASLQKFTGLPAPTCGP